MGVWRRALALRSAAVVTGAVLCVSVAAQAALDTPPDARALTIEIDRFLLREATAHFAGIPTLDPPPDRVLGARTVGEFSWGTFMRALAAIAQHAKTPTLADRDVAQWLVRQSPSLRFALPITTGTRPGVADYLPAPHGLPGFSVPVEHNLPALVPYLELEDGRTIVAADGADEIHPSADGRALRVVWRRWAQIGAKSGQFVDPGVTSEVTWTLHEDAPWRDEKLTVAAPMTIRSWRVIVPTTASTVTMPGAAALPPAEIVLSGERGTLGVVATSAVFTAVSTRATGNHSLGRGARGHIPLHLVFEAHDLRLSPSRPFTWHLGLRPQP